MTDVLIPRSLLRDPDGFGGVAQGTLQRGECVWRAGRLAGLTAPTGDNAQMLIPALVEPHCHLDKCHSLGRLGPVGGTLSDAIARQGRDKVNWTVEDIQTRGSRGLNEARIAGCGLIRSHVDWGEGPDAPLAWGVLHDLAAPDLQLSALTGLAQMADPAMGEPIVRQIARDGGALGAFVMDHPKELIEAGLTAMFDLAARFGVPLDFHVDEGLGPFNGLEMIADMALKTGFDGPILCGHAVSLMDRTPDDVARIAGKLARSGIVACALPTTNLYLQGRTNGTPDRRGLTRLRELNAAGVRVALGSDNVRDAFCPVGQHDPRAMLELAVLAGHLDPPLEQWLPLITTNAAKGLGHAPIYVDGARAEDLRVADTPSTADLIADRPLLRKIVL